MFQNIISATSASIVQLGLYAPHKNDVLFSFLPLAHTMERCCELAVYMAGGAVGFYSGGLISFFISLPWFLFLLVQH